jgi:hypothetical protein
VPNPVLISRIDPKHTVSDEPRRNYQNLKEDGRGSRLHQNSGTNFKWKSSYLFLWWVLVDTKCKGLDWRVLKRWRDVVGAVAGLFCILGIIEVNARSEKVIGARARLRSINSTIYIVFHYCGQKVSFHASFVRKSKAEVPTNAIFVHDEGFIPG